MRKERCLSQIISVLVKVDLTVSLYEIMTYRQ